MDAKERIKALMKTKNMTDYRLAKLSGLSQSTISNLFNRNNAPTIPTLEAICNGLGISMAQFFSDSESESLTYLTAEQKELFDEWLALSAEQKDIIKRIIKSYKN